MFVRKTFLLTSLLLITSLFSTSCETSESTARTIAHKYLNLRLNGNFESAQNLVTSESQPLLFDLKELSEEHSREKIALNYTIKRVRQNRESAEVLYDLEGFGEDYLDLIAENGQWKVILTHQSIPDAGLLMMELRSLEQADSADIDIEDLDDILMSEDFDVEWANN